MNLISDLTRKVRLASLRVATIEEIQNWPTLLDTKGTNFLQFVPFTLPQTL